MQKRIIILLSIIALLACYFEGLGWWDFDGQWAINVYLLHGVDPFLPHSSFELQALGLPTIPEGWGTSPWGMVLGQLLYPGWLSLTAAKWYFIMLHVAALVIALLWALKQFPEQRNSVLLIVFASLCWYIRPINSGNAGALMSLMLLFSVWRRKEYPVLAAVCLAFAMIKPQMALLFCLFLFLKCQYKVLFLAAAIDISAWIIASFQLQVSPFVLLQEFLGCNIGRPDSFYGIMTLLVTKSLAMPLSMLVGILFSLVGYWIHRKNSLLLQIIPFAIASSFWSYSWGNEMLVLLPFAIFLYSRMETSSSIWTRFGFIALFAYVVWGRLIITASKQIFMINHSDIVFPLAMTLYLVGCIIIMPWKKEESVA